MSQNFETRPLGTYIRQANSNLEGAIESAHRLHQHPEPDYNMLASYAPEVEQIARMAEKLLAILTQTSQPPER